MLRTFLLSLAVFGLVVQPALPQCVGGNCSRGLFGRRTIVHTQPVESATVYRRAIFPRWAARRATRASYGSSGGSYTAPASHGSSGGSYTAPAAETDSANDPPAAPGIEVEQVSGGRDSELRRSSFATSSVCPCGPECPCEPNCPCDQFAGVRVERAGPPELDGLIVERIVEVKLAPAVNVAQR